jgi:hypothetical protein
MKLVIDIMICKEKYLVLVLNTPQGYRIALESCSKKEELTDKIYIDWA